MKHNSGSARANTSNSSHKTQAFEFHPRLSASNEEHQYEYDNDETSEGEISICENDKIDESSVEFSNVELGTIEFIESDDFCDLENLRQLPLKTVAEVEWLDKEIAKIHSPYRNKIVRSPFFFLVNCIRSTFILKKMCFFWQ